MYLLDDPKGRTWIMTSYTDKIAAGLTIDKLETLGSLLTTAARLEVPRRGARQGTGPRRQERVRRHHPGRQREHL